MPFYEYECTSCKFYCEVMQKISDPPLRKCSSCGRSTLKKLVSAPNFRLKGGGWYETDFKSDQENKRNLAVEKEPESKAADSTAKPAAADAKAAEAKPAETKSEAPASAAEKPSRSARKPAARKSKPKAKAAPKRRASR